MVAFHFHRSATKVLQIRFHGFLTNFLTFCPWLSLLEKGFPDSYVTYASTELEVARNETSLSRGNRC